MIALMYHDVVEPGQEDSSGFPGSSAARYKLTTSTFREHLAVLAGALPAPPSTAAELLAKSGAKQMLLTFDDGGRSAAEPIADLLEERRWRGHFLVTTERIGTASFLSAEQIRNLRRRGHVIGSHSHSHPQRMALCPWEQLIGEWSRSCAVLSDILGEAVTVASVPGGFHSRRVAEAADLAGIRVLFNSEPTTRVKKIHQCLIVGRYTIYETMTAASAAALVSCWPWRRHAQTVAWEIKKAAKVVGGRAYLRLRESLLARAHRK